MSVEAALKVTLNNSGFSLNLNDVYNFSGTFEMPTLTHPHSNGKGGTKTNQYGLSHLTMLAHDPSGGSAGQIPEPSVLFLLGSGLIGLAWSRRQ